MYLITFEDGTTYDGGDISNSKWNEMPDKKIASIQYYLGNQMVVASGYEEYNHLIDKLGIDGQIYITGIRLLAKFEDRVDIYSYDTRMREVMKEVSSSKGPIYTKSTGWKLGLKKDTPEFVVNDVESKKKPV